ncbi:hypothetical protein CN514_18655 [Bacillus sp. AFS001701]|uniref:hypothetical protein n=1 Tax=Bacillus sp. AFS001701 TaxID=2033480 RepID=UPI000BF2A76D|nr:hypothetical protein [Bacillus sp. AFS001701]PET54302.1 hypothetical protein CN514_18655 [Bacillus sp. AFS001701]
MKKILTSILTVACVIGSVKPAFADTASTTKPNVTYGSTSEFGYKEFMGPWQNDKWNYYAYSYKYSNWDKDIYNAVNSNSSVTVTAQSETQYSLSGSTEFGIKKLLKLI